MFSVWPLRGFDAGCQNVCTLLEHPVGLLELAVALSFTCVSVCFHFWNTLLSSARLRVLDHPVYKQTYVWISLVRTGRAYAHSYRHHQMIFSAAAGTSL